MGDRETAAERAERRRRTWSGGVAHSFAEMDEIDLQFWLRATPAERVRAVTELALTIFEPRTNDGSAPRLQRSVGGVRPRKG